ncbi:MAG: stage 0 sporulation family protein [Clostridia bacterium]|nr:stage 0 sporulation family protein [Clostridia bacterium]
MGKMYFFDPNGVKYQPGTHVLVKTSRGVEYATVSMANTVVSGDKIVPPLRRVLRAATKSDDERHEANLESEREAFRIFDKKIADHKLEMKPVDVEYTFDNNRLTFYFTADGRVDFRDLVKDLASVFKTRIELRQIGIRDETKIIGGLGVCGRPFCCASFLPEFSQVSIKMAKEQNLSLNSAKISGVCGKLMCCLRFEHESYEEEAKRSPKVDQIVRTPDGEGTVTEVNLISGAIKVRLSAEPDKPPKTYKREDLIRTTKSAEPPAQTVIRPSTLEGEQPEVKQDEPAQTPKDQPKKQRHAHRQRHRPRKNGQENKDNK